MCLGSASYRIYRIRLPRLTGEQLIKALNKVGFEVIRTKGSHHCLRHTDGRAMVPVHSGETVGLRLLKSNFKGLRPRSRAIGRVSIVS
ncbi:MAG: type II toxin-antitoxin system HicA family toxin [Methylococcales bacterium]